MKSWKVVAAGVVTAAVVCAAGCDSGGGGGGEYHAVVVGVSRYRVPSFDLSYADDDAVAFTDTLLRGRNWEPGDVTTLLNGQATKAAIREAIARTASRMGEGDKFVLFFSGHGTFGPDLPPLDEADRRDEYLVPYDALEFSGANDIRDDELQGWLDAVPGGGIAVILDSSFSGGIFKGLDRVKGIVRPGADEGFRAGADGMTRDLSRAGTIVLTASDAHESPIESSAIGHGVFTYYLVEGLGGPADNGDGRVSAEEAFAYAAPRSNDFYPGMHPQMLDLFPGQYVLVR